MPSAAPPQVRDIIIHQYLMGLSVQQIHTLTKVPARSISRYIKRYKDEGTIYTLSERYGDNRGRPRVISNEDLIVMCYVWTRDPTLYIDEVALEMSIILDKWVNPKNLWYWIKELGITRKKLWKVCIDTYRYR